MKKSATIDWLSVTSRSPKFNASWSKKREVKPRGMLGYDIAIIYDDGRIQLQNSTRADMKTHIIHSGDTLAKMRGMYGINSLQILENYKTDTPTRIDIAIDVFDGQLNIPALATAFDNRDAKTRTRVGLFYEGRGAAKGETLYIGSPKSDRRLRIYDKKAETGSQAHDTWFRIELQLRGHYAVEAFRALINTDEQFVFSVIAGIINSYCKFEAPEWLYIMGSDEFVLDGQPKTENNIRRWIIETCVPSIARECVRSADGDAFYQTVIDLIAEIILESRAENKNG